MLYLEQTIKSIICAFYLSVSMILLNSGFCRYLIIFLITFTIAVIMQYSFRHLAMLFYYDNNQVAHSNAYYLHFSTVNVNMVKAQPVKCQM